ncbi:MAG: hypothetical protein CL678_11525 [Bdellovibrionaceae bacterium]|nr:hypothetical protein [Pseudobdellovibrionaceae bacterium]|tara:strand:- start:3374 stop:4312 length:939 start_codon:yes stop_codon:yes gene_type:complete
MKALLFLLSLTLIGCSQFLGKLRQDLRPDQGTYGEPSTVGGAWPEGKLLDDSQMYDERQVGHVDRGIASAKEYNQHAGPNQWISPEQVAQSQRDAYRSAYSSYSEMRNVAPNAKYKYGNRARKEDFMDTEEAPASLWASTGQTNYYFTKNNVKSIGDIIQIEVEPQLITDTAVEIKKTLNDEEFEMELMIAQEKLRQKALGIDPNQKDKKKKPGTEVATENADPKEVEVREANVSDIDLVPVIGLKEKEIIMGEVMERFPNGNYKIRAMKRVPYRTGMRYVSLVGIAKSADVESEKPLKSSQIYEYRLKGMR